VCRVIIKLLAIKGSNVILAERAAKYATHIGLPIAICFFGGGRLSAQQPPTAPPANAAPQVTAPPAPQANAAPQVTEPLKILVLVGQDAVNNIRVPAPADLAVEVRDQNDQPLEGATVNFQLPLMGPSGGFEGGVRNKDFRTNVQGQVSTSYTPNMETGRFTIQVKATLGGQTGMASILQRNATESAANAQGPKNQSWIGRHKLLVVLIGAAVVGGVLAAVLTRGGKSSSSSGATVTITPGVPTVTGSQ
jgi:hypothetical protein